jgi:predicted RNase H-like nuclease
VFAIAPRPVWSCASYQEANRLCRQLTGQGLSAQAWGLRAKLLDANEHRSRLGLLEVHPELSFAAMAGGVLSFSKHVPAGRELRLSLLETAGIVLPADARDTDTIDAAAVAWSAARIADGSAVTLPDPPDYDPAGLEIAIRY